MLTAVAARNASPREKPYKLAAGGGLYLEVMPTGARYWRWKYRFAGKEKRLALGVFPQVSLKSAKDAAEEARAMLRKGVDPSAERAVAKLRAVASSENTFGAISSEWLEKQRNKLAPITFAKAQWILGKASALNRRPITEIGPADILAILHGVEKGGRHETAHRVKQRIGQVFRYAIATRRVQSDPTRDLREALAPIVSTPRAAVTDPKDVGDLLRAIDSYEGQPATQAALRLAPLLFVRPGNLRAMEWSELDLDGAEWRIPGGKMKMREAHIVPLPAQAVAILRDIHAFTGRGRYVFPSLRTPDRPMSDNTINAALRRLGYDKATMTGHGFRALASTRLNEMGWPTDVIERQLAHAERNKVRAVYNRAQYMAERRKMMDAWADYLDQLRSGGNVVSLHTKSGASR